MQIRIMYMYTTSEIEIEVWLKKGMFKSKQRSRTTLYQVEIIVLYEYEH